MTLTGPISFSRCGVSPRWATLRDDLGAHALHEAQALVADAGDADFGGTVALPFAHRGDQHAQDVGVEAAAQALVGRHHDQADACRLGLPLPLARKGCR